MVDISKCHGEFCSKKEICYRFTATASDYQSYMVIEKENQGEKCEYFYPISQNSDYKHGRNPKQD